MNDKHDDNDSHDHRKPPAAPTIINVLIYAMRAIAEHRRAERANRQTEKRLAIWTTVSTGVVAVFTLVLAVATAFLYRATADMANDGREAIYEANRAWVAVKGAKIRSDYIFKIGEGIPLDVMVQNGGKSPATNVTVTADFDEIDKVPFNNFKLLSPMENDTCESNSEPVPTGVAYPSNGIEDVDHLGLISNVGGSQVVFDDDLLNQRKYLRVRGCIHYSTMKDNSPSRNSAP